MYRDEATQGQIASTRDEQTSTRCSNIKECGAETDKYTAELLHSVMQVADAICGSSPEKSGENAPAPSGLVYWMAQHRSELGEIGAQVYRIRRAFGLDK